MTTVRTQISDAELRRIGESTAATDVRDTRYPILLRFRQCRQRGSWYWVRYESAKTIRTKLGNWPDTSARQLFKNLPDLTNATQAGSGDSESWHQTGQLLNWYRERVKLDRTLSNDRRLNIDSSIGRHLVPRLGEHPIAALSRQLLDEIFIWPMQNQYALATVRFHFAVLKRAFKLAHRFGRLRTNPIEGINFTDFIDRPIAPRGSRLQGSDLDGVLKSIHGAHEPTQTLSMLLLLHGTRIGETRQIKWRHIDWGAKRLTLPADITKTGREHRIPLTDFAATLLKKRAQSVKGEYVFPGERGPLKRQDATRLIRTLSQGHWSAHDLRKLARSWWADLGIDYLVAERLLNHAMTKLDRTYIHTALDQQKLEALERWHGLIEAKLSDILPTHDEVCTA
ncbi:MAG: site-specific integrase [Idiomarina sp.]|nr:site-specific integrase [Idiomarina sp.]